MGNILVIEKDTAVRQFFYEALTQDGHAVSTCPPGAKFMELARAHAPEIVFLDPVQMPEDDAMDLIEGFSSRSPVILFSGEISAQLERKAFEKGAVAKFDKKSPAQELCLRVGRLLKSELPAGQEDSKILVVDDEPGIRLLVSGILEKKGFNVSSAADGRQALAALQKEQPQLILLDITMPGMDGILTLKKIRETNKRVQVILVTSVGDEEILQEAQALGIYGYLQKPFKVDRLELMVNTALLMADET